MYGSPQHQPSLYTIVAADVAGSGALRDREQLRMRAALHEVFDRALRGSRIGRDAIDIQDLGDGIRVIVDARVSPRLLLDPFIPRLADGLRHHRAGTAAGPLRLRVVVHLGLLYHDLIGWAGAPLVHCTRLLDAEPVRCALAVADRADLALIVSQTMYDAVVQQGYGLDRTTYRAVRVCAKETTTVGWVHVPGYHQPPGIEHESEVDRGLERLP